MSVYRSVKDEARQMVPLVKCGQVNLAETAGGKGR